VVQRCQQFRFAVESQNMTGVTREFLRQHFHGNVTLQFRVASSIYLAHPTRANLRDNFVRP
jgi:hypothetical protein